MSHEIRTPMTVILGMADLLAETPLSVEQRQYVQVFKRSGDLLRSLIENVLDLSKVEAGQITIEQVDFDLAELVETTAEMLAIRAHSMGIELSCHIAPGTPTLLTGDAMRLRQVLVNLLDMVQATAEQI